MLGSGKPMVDKVDKMEKFYNLKKHTTILIKKKTSKCNETVLKKQKLGSSDYFFKWRYS